MIRYYLHELKMWWLQRKFKKEASERERIERWRESTGGKKCWRCGDICGSTECKRCAWIMDGDR